MNTINHTYQVRGKTVRLQELADVIAVLNSTAPQAESVNIASLLPEGASLQMNAFQNAGWRFASAQQAEKGSKVYLKANGRVALGTPQLSVAVDSTFTENEARKLIESQGLTIKQQLKFAPNLFVVAVEEGKDSVELAQQLSSVPGFLFAEPELIEQISGR